MCAPRPGLETFEGTVIKTDELNTTFVLDVKSVHVSDLDYHHDYEATFSQQEFNTTGSLRQLNAINEIAISGNTVLTDFVLAHKKPRPGNEQNAIQKSLASLRDSYPEFYSAHAEWHQGLELEQSQKLAIEVWLQNRTFCAQTSPGTGKFGLAVLLATFVATLSRHEQPQNVLIVSPIIKYGKANASAMINILSTLPRTCTMQSELSISPHGTKHSTVSTRIASASQRQGPCRRTPSLTNFSFGTRSVSWRRLSIPKAMNKSPKAMIKSPKAIIKS